MGVRRPTREGIGDNLSSVRATPHPCPPPQGGRVRHPHCFDGSAAGSNLPDSQAHGLRDIVREARYRFAGLPGI